MRTKRVSAMGFTIFESQSQVLESMSPHLQNGASSLHMDEQGCVAQCLSRKPSDSILIRHLVNKW